MTQRHLTLQLLGSTSILLDGKPIRKLSTRAAEALVIYVLHQSRPVPREQLADMFFQASEPKQAAANLRAMLSQIKKELDPFIEITRYTVGRREDVSFSVDSIQFSDRLAKGADQLNAHELQTALANYHGDFLAGFYLRDAPEYEQWVLIERERLRLLAIEGLQRLIGLQVAAGAFRDALFSAEKLLAIEPLLESVHRVKMEMLARTGQRALALRHFTLAEEIFAEQLDVALSDSTVALRERIHALRDPLPHNLPAMRGEFIGREAEIDDVIERLARPTGRLLTLLGMGGIGKTRLAEATARRLLSAGIFLDGIFLVSLAAQETTEQMVLQIADALDLSLRGSQPATVQLIDYLRERETLLILDNLEQLVNDATVHLLTQMLREAPGLKLLLTSRLRLNLYEEQVFELEGLSLPEAMEETEAVRLFLTCARRQQRQFAPDSAERAAIYALCHLLEGVPLSLELAAAQVRQQSSTAILAAIQESLDVLKTHFHNVSDRQRSLRAVFDYSWALLSAEQRTVFPRLAVFPASFTASAALNVATTSESVLRQLQDHSLIRVDDHDRLQLHAALREYAAEKLVDSAAIRNAHAAYYTDALTQLAARAMDKAGYQRVRRELPNLLAAWEEWLRARRFGQLEQLVQPLFEYYNWSGRWLAGIALFAETAARLPAEQSILRAMLEVRLGRLYLFMGESSRADTLIASGLEQLEQTDRSVECAAGYGHRSMAVFRQGAFELAQQYARRGLAYGLTAEDDDAIAYNHNLLASALSAAGKREEAQGHLEAALAIRRDQNDQLGVGILLNNLGNLLIDTANYTAAFDSLKNSATIFRTLEHKHGEATALSNAAVAAGRLEQYDVAEQLQYESLAIKRELGNKRSIALSLATLADAKVSQGKLAEAESCLREGLQVALTTDAAVSLDEILVSSAELFLATGRQTSADALFSFLANSSTTREAVLERVAKAQRPPQTTEPPTRAHILDLLNREFSL